MNRKPQKPEQRSSRLSRRTVEYGSVPSALARRYWLYVLGAGTAAPVPRGFAKAHQDEARFLLHYVRRGEMWYTTRNRTHRAAAGSVSLMSLGEVVRYGVDRTDETELWWVLFGGRDMPDLFLELGGDKVPVFELPDVRRFERLFRELIGLTHRRPPAYQAKSCGLLTLLMGELFAASGKCDETEIGLGDETEIALGDETKLRPAQLSEPVLSGIRRIGRFYGDVLTLEGIRQGTNLSLHHFVRLFHRETGMSPVRYLARYRVEKAKQLLLTTHLSVKEIARMVGVPDPYSFTRMFHRIAGCAPSQCRAEKASPEDA